MSTFYDELETRDPARREAQLFEDLPGQIEHAMTAPGWKRHLGCSSVWAPRSGGAEASRDGVRSSEKGCRVMRSVPSA